MRFVFRAGRLRRDPLAFPGMRIGLFGGSFDPAHAGHAHVAHTVLRRLQLDRVWWLVTPQNPLKPRSGAFAERFASARAVAKGRRMVVTDIETRLGLAYSAQTVAALQSRYPQVRFVWVMGEDNLASFHRWRDWHALAKRVPIAIVTRPGVSLRAHASPAFARLAPFRAPAGGDALVWRRPPPVWATLAARDEASSSTAIRARRAVTTR